MTKMTDDVRRWCAEHYENGWADLVVETMDDAELTKVIGTARTLKGAVRKVREALRDYADYRADVMATADRDLGVPTPEESEAEARAARAERCAYNRHMYEVCYHCEAADSDDAAREAWEAMTPEERARMEAWLAEVAAAEAEHRARVAAEKAAADAAGEPWF